MTSFYLRHDSGFFLAVKFLERFQLLNELLILILQHGYAILEALDVIFLLTSTFARRLSENRSNYLWKFCREIDRFNYSWEFRFFYFIFKIVEKNEGAIKKWKQNDFSLVYIRLYPPSSHQLVSRSAIILSTKFSDNICRILMVVDNRNSTGLMCCENWSSLSITPQKKISGYTADTEHARTPVDNYGLTSPGKKWRG